MNQAATFRSATGASFYLEIDQPALIKNYLSERNWLEPGEKVHTIERPGEGNMNQVIRVKTNRRSFILKQSRPWVQKFPQIQAPVERVLIEADFYELAERDPYFRQFMPQVLEKDAENYVLTLEDLGAGADFTFIYKKDHYIGSLHLEQLLVLLSHLHRLEFDPVTRQAFPDNLGMRRLNHEHLFIFPLEKNTGFNLDTVLPGLQAAAVPYRHDNDLRERMNELGKLYLSPGSSLLHGDFFPGSWLKVGSEVKVIDPEFCFFGPPEYDLGVAVAHLKMARMKDSEIDQAKRAYAAPAGFDEELRRAFTGMELIRRLIGLAQLPLDLSLEERKTLLAEAKALLMG